MVLILSAEKSDTRHEGDGEGSVPTDRTTSCPQSPCTNKEVTEGLYLPSSPETPVLPRVLPQSVSDQMSLSNLFPSRPKTPVTFFFASSS